MKYLILLFIGAGSSNVLADPHWYQPAIYTTEVTEVTEVVNVTELVNTTNIENYTVDKCTGFAAAQASGNNQLYFGSDKPQLSLGLGECGGDVASSLMFGMKLKNNLMVNGSWLTDNDANAFGAGITVIFK